MIGVGDDMGVKFYMSNKQLRELRAMYELAAMRLEEPDYRECLMARGCAGLVDAAFTLNQKLPDMMKELDVIIKKSEIFAKKQKELDRELELLDDNF